MLKKKHTHTNEHDDVSSSFLAMTSTLDFFSHTFQWQPDAFIIQLAEHHKSKKMPDSL